MQSTQKYLGKVIFSIVILFALYFAYLAFTHIPQSSDGENEKNTQVKKELTENEKLQNLHWVSATTSAPWGDRDAESVVVFKDQLYLIGGLMGNKAVNRKGTIEYWNAPHMSDIWRTKDGFNWERVTDNAPWKNRRSVTTVVFQGKLWLMGGWDQYSYKYDNRIWYTDDGDHWFLATSTSPRWEGREGHTLNEFGGKLWLTGGVNFTKRITYNDVWYSDDGFTWHEATKNAPWSARYDHAVATYKGKLYLAGGIHINTHITEADLWSTTDGIHWEKSTPQWPSRHGLILTEFKDRLWVVGGWHSDPKNKSNDMGINDTWFTEDGKQWYKTKTDGPWLGREDHMGEVWNGKIWFMGGMDKNIHWNSDVWYSEL